MSGMRTLAIVCVAMAAGVCVAAAYHALPNWPLAAISIVGAAGNCFAAWLIGRGWP